MIDANFNRICKLAVISGAASLCAASAAFPLQGHLRQIAAGAAAGLAFLTAASLVEGYRRRGLVDTSPAAKEQKSQRGRTVSVLGTTLGALLILPMRLLHLEWLVIGCAIGMVAFVGLLISPLFWTRSGPPVDPSPRARMTSAERSVGVRYE